MSVSRNAWPAPPLRTVSSNSAFSAKVPRGIHQIALSGFCCALCGHDARRVLMMKPSNQITPIALACHFAEVRGPLCCHGNFGASGPWGEIREVDTCIAPALVPESWQMICHAYKNKGVRKYSGLCKVIFFAFNSKNVKTSLSSPSVWNPDPLSGRFDWAWARQLHGLRAFRRAHGCAGCGDGDLENFRHSDLKTCKNNMKIIWFLCARLLSTCVENQHVAL